MKGVFDTVKSEIFCQINQLQKSQNINYGKTNICEYALKLS